MSDTPKRSPSPPDPHAIKCMDCDGVGSVGRKPHGRTAYTLSCGWCHCAIDMQFMPKAKGGE